jgi:RNA polymerase sigma factor (sigma-70 family)
MVDVDALYREYREYVRIFLSKRGVSYDEIDDLASETWERLARKADRYRDDHPKALVLAVVRSVFLDYARKRKYRQTVPLDDPAVAPFVATADGLSASVAYGVTVEDVLRVLDDTPPFRAVIEMHYLRGMSHPEIARAMGRTHQATRTLNLRAMRRLREHFAGVPDPGRWANRARATA